MEFPIIRICTVFRTTPDVFKENDIIRINLKIKKMEDLYIVLVAFVAIGLFNLGRAFIQMIKRI